MKRLKNKWLINIFKKLFLGFLFFHYSYGDQTSDLTAKQNQKISQNSKIKNCYKTFKDLFNTKYDRFKQSEVFLALKEKRFVEEQLSVNFRDSENWTRLHEASNHHNPQEALEQVQNLINQGAKTDFLNSNGDTPMHLSAQRKHWRVTEILVTKGAKTNISNNTGDTPMHLAAERGDLKTVEVLFSNKPANKFNIKNNKGLNPFHLAIKWRHLKVLEFFIEKGFPVDIRTGYLGSLGFGETTLYLGVKTGDPKIVEFLIKNGADVNAKTRGQSPLNLARSLRNEEIEQLFVEQNAEDHSPL